MARFISITLSVLAGILALLIAALLILIYSPYGIKLADRISRPIIEQQLDEQLGSEVTYAPLAGRFPSQIIIRDLTISHQGEPWAEADRFVLRWNPWALLRGEVRVNEVVLVEGVYRGIPVNEAADPVPVEEPREEPSPSKGGGIKLRYTLQSLVINDFTVGEEVLGQTYLLSLIGSGQYDAPSLNAELFLETAEGSDQLGLDIDFDGAMLRAHADLSSKEDGIITNLIGAEGGIAFSSYAEGQSRNIEGSFEAQLGVYGGVSGAFDGHVGTPRSLHSTIAYAPGSILSEEALLALGEAPSIESTLQQHEDGYALTLDALRTAAATLSGEADLTTSGNRAATLSLQGSLAEDVLESFGAPMLAGPFAFSASGNAIETGYTYDAELRAGVASLFIKDGRSDDKHIASGEVRVETTPFTLGQTYPDLLLAEGVTLTAGLRLTQDRIVQFERLDLTSGEEIGNRITANGDGQYGLETGDLQADLTLQAEQNALARAVGTVAFDGAMILDLGAQGNAKDFRLDAELAIPAGRMGEEIFAPGRLQAQASGLPASPDVSATLFTADGSYGGNLDAQSNGQTLAIETLRFNAQGLTLSANAAADLETLAGQLQLNASAAPGTQIITGQSVRGNLNLTAEIGANLETISARLEAQNLSIDENDIVGLDLTAQGPKSAVAFDLAATDVSLADLFFSEVTTRGSADLTEASEAAVSQFIVVMPGEDRSISLRQPTTLSWADGFTLAPTQLQVFSNGNAEFAASFTPERWQLTVNASQIPLSTMPTELGLSVNLDTNEVVPATIELTAATTFNEQDLLLRSNGQWDGQQINLASRLQGDGAEELGTISAKLPLVLERADGLSVIVPETDLAARIHYNHTVEALLAFVSEENAPAKGPISVDVSISGQMTEPQATGEILLGGVRVEEEEFGLLVDNLQGGVRLSYGPQGTLGDVQITGSGTEGREGAVRLEGSLQADKEGSSVDLALVLDRAQLANSADLQLRGSADLALTGSFESLLLAGAVNLDEFDLTIPSVEAESSGPQYTPVNVVRTDAADVPEATEPESNSTDSDFALDLTVKADNGIFIRGRGLDSEWSADLAVLGTIVEPIVGGEIAIVNGEINLAGRTFDITRGDVGFQRTTDIDPLIELEATTLTGEDEDVTAIARVQGPASDPTLSFSSTPSLPEEDVLALILFGKPAAELGASEALQLASAAATLSGAFGGGAGITGSLRNDLGLDRLTIDPSARTLEVGKYVSEDIYVSARQSLTQAGTIISIVYELSRFVSLESTLQPNGAQSVGATYRRDY